MDIRGQDWAYLYKKIFFVSSNYSNHKYIKSFKEANVTTISGNFTLYNVSQFSQDENFWETPYVKD